MAAPILVFGDDRSPSADRAWMWINNQAWAGWTLEVVTATPHAGDIVSNDLAIELTPWTPDEPRHPFAEAGIGRIRHLRSPADPDLVLRACEHATLLVVGPRGRSAAATAILGSTTDDLLQQPPVPLVVTRSIEPATRVLVCTDGSAHALHAVETFARLPLADHADAVAVLGIVTDDTGQRRAVERGVGAAVGLLERLDPECLTVRWRGTVARTIVEQATAWDARLVVVGTRCQTRFRRLLFGSTTTALARAVPSSLLAVPTGVATASGDASARRVADPVG